MFYLQDETDRPDSPQEEEKINSNPEGDLGVDHSAEKKSNKILPEVKHRNDWRRRLSGR